MLVDPFYGSPYGSPYGYPAGVPSTAAGAATPSVCTLQQGQIVNYLGAVDSALAEVESGCQSLG